MVEDTSPGAHDTLTAACDANQYAALGVDKPEEHGSCAENLVLALKELNENAGLKGPKAVGADITVNIAPTPLHLFMNVPLQIDNKTNAEGAGAKGVKLQVDEPKGKKRSFVRFRAERDVVVVFSACPMDVGKQNGGRCMAANYMVEDVQEGEDLAASMSSAKGKKAPKKLAPKDKPEPKKEDAEDKTEVESKDDTQEKSSTPEKAKRPAPKKLQSSKGKESSASTSDAPKDTASEEKKGESVAEPPKEKKKPKKLQVRNGGSSTPTKSS